MTHPLTDEKALTLFLFERLTDASQPITIEDAMRRAADWQLEQCTEWLDEALSQHRVVDSFGFFVPSYKLEERLKKAMRSQQQEDNS